MSRKILAGGAAVITLCLSLSAAHAQTAPADALSDPSLKGPEVVAFVGAKPGDQIADLFGGRFVRAFSQAVGPKGKVYAVEFAELVKLEPKAVDGVKSIAAMPAYANVTITTPPAAAPALPQGLDEVFIRQNYHDLYDKFMGPTDVAAFNKAVFAALKPGGVYVILDHAAAPGADMSVTETLHRIDEARVKADLKAAGFVLDGESKVLANAADDHSKKVFDPAIRGKTDQFLLKFRKPK